MRLVLFPAGNAAALADAVQQSLAAVSPAPATMPHTWDDSAAALVDLLAGIPAAPLAERAAPWTPRQITRHALNAVLPRRAMLSSGQRDSGAVCLTFDDGPHEVHTPALLDLLRENGIHASFFVIGERAARYPELMRRIADEGHTIAHHTYTHGEPHNVSAAVLDAEILQCDAAFTAAGVSAVRVFRPPYGKLSAAKLAVVWRARLTVVLWSRDSKDWQATITAEQIHRRFANPPLRAGDVVLFHELFPATVESLPQIIAATRAAGLGFTTVGRWTHPADEHYPAVAALSS